MKLATKSFGLSASHELLEIVCIVESLQVDFLSGVLTALKQA